MESPTPETGTPESQSPARTPPALITTEELLQSCLTKSPEAATSAFAPSPRGSVSRRAAVERYEYLRAADAGHRLQGMRLPPEEELRAAALGGLPAVGPPPWLPHQLSPALQSVLVGWRSVYESCRTAPVLQALVGDCYAPEAVFEDALVSARGQEAVYRQFAMLGAAIHAVQVAAYSLSVAPLYQPLVVLAEVTPTSPGPASSTYTTTAGAAQARASAAAAPRPGQPQPQLAGLRLPRPPGSEREAGPSVSPSHPQQPQQPRPLHLTRVTVENVQCFQLGLPPWLTWLVGGKAPGLKVHLYVTSILLVASDAPLAMDQHLGGGAGAAGRPAGWPSDLTASRLAGAAAALGRAALGGGGPPAGPSDAGAGGAAMGAHPAPAPPPSWRIVHHVDIWHNVPLVWWRLRRALGAALDALLAPLLRI